VTISIDYSGDASMTQSSLDCECLDVIFHHHVCMSGPRIVKSDTVEPNLSYRLYPCMGHAVRGIRTSGHVAKTRLSYVKLGPNVSMTASMFALWFLNTSGREAWQSD